ncbi:hypothetical protein HD554DRAFT_2040954 [Boletus coccyginus]|nr:hypothetical protein HD554DRAFT_2040954 [Boletus coccyginus]
MKTTSNNTLTRVPGPTRRPTAPEKSDDDEPLVDAKAIVEIKSTVIRPSECWITDIPDLFVGRLRAVVPPIQSTTLNHNGGKSLAGGPKPHPRAGDYNDPTHHTLDTAIEFYHAILLTEIPFLQLHVEVKWTKSAWDLSCQFYHETNTEYNPDILKLATRASNLCGQFKIKAHSIVAIMFGFELSASATVECAIDKWASGSHEWIAFTEEAYMPIYNVHIDNLEFFHKSTQMLNILLMIMRWMYDNKNITIFAVVINDVINEFDLEHKQGTDEKQDDEVSTDKVDDWQDEVEEAGHEQVELDNTTACYSLLHRSILSRSSYTVYYNGGKSMDSIEIGYLDK